MMKKIMTGNEAIARGAWEAGLHVAGRLPRHAFDGDTGKPLRVQGCLFRVGDE